MDLAAIWDLLANSIRDVPKSGLVVGAFAAMMAGIVGRAIIRRAPAVGKTLTTLSTLALMGVLMLVVLQLSHMDSRYTMSMAETALPQQIVEGGETRIPMAQDGHYWLEASVNGYRARFLVDTGATLTAVSADTAAAAGLAPEPDGFPIRMQTANGPVSAERTSITELRFGNVAARGLDAIIAPGLGQTNVIGMNLLSKLESVRLEGQTMVLVPHHPQPELTPAD